MFKIPNSKNELTIFIDNLPIKSGVYKFIGKDKYPLYIGKAKNIKKRVSTYFRNSNTSKKIHGLIQDSIFLEIILTNTELEALLLEQHLIKKIRPKFNVQFKDDKGYPWIKIETNVKFPSAKSFLGKKNKKERLFGPFPSAYAVKDTLNIIQKIFKLRNCSDTVFKNRTRPCLQYQIGRCSAPCVGLITQQDYFQEVKSASKLLEGKGEALLADLYMSMDQYSEKQSYEKAAIYRDKISKLRDIQRSQNIHGYKHARDAVSISSKNGITKVGITHVKEGWITGHQNFIQKVEGIENSLLETFIKSYYLSADQCPRTIVVNEKILEKSKIEEALSKYHRKAVKIIVKPGKRDKGLIDISIANTKLSVEREQKKIRNLSPILKALKDQFKLTRNIDLIESYDISHFSAAAAVGACIVFNKNGKLKENYRLFNISKKNSGNDIGSMQEIIKRRFGVNRTNTEKPSLLIIDGGKVHLDKVRATLENLNIFDIDIIAISKGARRKALMDSIHTTNGNVVKIIQGSPSHLLIQEIRDETHRFAITRQKKKQSKVSMESRLDSIIGIGEERKSYLLRYFGTLEQIERASIEDLLRVSGIGESTANTIFQELHNS